LQTIEPTWPLARWGIDIIGKLPAAQGNYQYAVGLVKSFTEWIEAKPITNMSFTTLRKLLWPNIICRFRVLRQIIVDKEHNLTVKTKAPKVKWSNSKGK
jgi:hypothetical protein